MKIGIIILLGFLFFSCSSGSVPRGILPPEKMEKVVYDLMQIDEYLNTFVIKDSSVNIKEKRSIFYDQVFNLNNTSRKDFYSSYKYYQQHPDKQKILFDSLLAKGNRSKNENPTIPPARLPGKEKLVP